MITERTSRSAPGGRRGWIFYDGRCPLCAGGARGLGPIAARRGFALVPLQRHWVRGRLDMPEHQRMSAMWVLRTDGRLVGGADAFVYLAGFVWWAAPLAWLGRIPPVMRLLRPLYARIARNRYCIAGACGLRGSPAGEPSPLRAEGQRI